MIPTTNRSPQEETVTVEELAFLLEKREISHCFIDLDGTLLDGDSLPAFCLFLLKHWWYRLGFHRHVSLPLLLYALGLQRRKTFKPKLAKFFRGWRRHRVEELGTKFVHEILSPKVRKSMYKLLATCRRLGIQTVIASASLDAYCEPMARLLQIDALLCTKLAYRNGVCIGCLSTPNCKGQEKLARIQKSCQKWEVHPGRACFLSDHESDYPCLKYVGLGLTVNPTPTLRALALSYSMLDLKI